MSGGTGGANHLRVGKYGSKRAHPLCGVDQLGYMWSRAEFDKMVENGCACRACEITLERDTVDKINQEIFRAQMKQIETLQTNLALVSIQLHETMSAPFEVDYLDPANWNKPLWCAHGYKSHPSIHCLMIKPCPSVNFQPFVWGYSVWKRQPGFRTLGLSFEEFHKNKDLYLYFDKKQAALNYLSKILEPKNAA